VGLEASTAFEILLLSTAVITAGASFLRFSAQFPVPLDPAALPAPRFLRWPRAWRIALLRGPAVWWTALIVIAVAAGWGVFGAELIAWTTTGSPNAQILLTDEALRSAWIRGTVIFAVLALIVLPALAMILGVRNLLAGYRSASREDRRRVLWLIAGVSIASWMLLVPLLALPLTVLTGLSVDWLPFVVGLFWVFAPAVLVGAAAVAVF
jgi:hypothetical protein